MLVKKNLNTLCLNALSMVNGGFFNDMNMDNIINMHEIFVQKIIPYHEENRAAKTHAIGIRITR